jgi:predicted nucleic acid-binding protein
MIVVDTSAFISLRAADTLDLFLHEFDTHTTETVINELEDLASYNDTPAQHSQDVLQQRDRFTVHDVDTPAYQSSRIDAGEASCLQLTEQLDADFFITDDLHALPELQALTQTQIAISPIVLKALVQRDVLTRTEALNRLDTAAEQRDWLGAPIYRKARNLFNTE